MTRIAAKWTITEQNSLAECFFGGVVFQGVEGSLVDARLLEYKGQLRPMQCNLNIVLVM